MLKQKVLMKIKGLLDEWLLGFNEDDLKINMFSSEKFNIKNAIINVSVNQSHLKSKNESLKLDALNYHIPVKHINPKSQNCVFCKNTLKINSHISSQY